MSLQFKATSWRAEASSRCLEDWEAGEKRWDVATCAPDGLDLQEVARMW